MLTRKKVIDNLESYMESTNQTQTDIAKRLQVTPQAINNWLTRRREPSEETRFSVPFSSYSRTSVRNLNRRGPLPGSALVSVDSFDSLFPSGNCPLGRRSSRSSHRCRPEGHTSQGVTGSEFGANHTKKTSHFGEVFFVWSVLDSNQ